MNYLGAALLLLLGLQWHSAMARSGGEAAEPSPEVLDAAFTREDAAREAAAFSSDIPARGASDPLQAMIDATDLVFRGTVNSQSFVYDADGIPFTHTTLTIDEMLKGRHPNGEITLIQQGGPARDRKDKIMLVSSSLLFNIGDEELLFVNLDEGNPNARERTTVNQRFRIYEGKVYSEDGRGVTVETDGRGAGRRLVLSDDRHPSAYFRQIRIGEHTLTRNFGPDAVQPDPTPKPRKANALSPSPVRSFTDSVDVQTFSEALAQ